MIHLSQEEYKKDLINNHQYFNTNTSERDTMIVKDNHDEGQA